MISSKIFSSLFVLACCLSTTACRITRQAVTNKESVSNKITENTTTYRDTVLFTPKAQTTLSIPVASFSKCQETAFKDPLNGFKQPQIFTQKNGNATATVKIQHDTVTVTAECDSLAMVAKIKERFLFNQSESSVINDQYIEEKTKLNWQLVIILMTIAFIAGLVIRSLIKISI